MALLWYDGFNSASATEIALSYNASAFVGATTSYPRTGAGYLRFTTSGGYVQKNVSPSGGFVIGVAIHKELTNPSGESSFMSIREGATVHLYLTLSSDYKIRLYRGDATLLATSTNAIPAYSTSVSDYRHIELKCTIHDTTGSFTLRIEGVVEASGSGVDTRNGGTGVIDNFRLESNSNTTYLGFDDLYALDTSGATHNDFLGSSARVDTLSVDGAGDVTQWTPSTGSNYQNVDETGANNGDTDYNSAATTGLKDSFSCSNLPTSGVDVQAVRARVVARKDDSGTCQIKVGIRSSGVESTESAQSLTTSYAAYFSSLHTVDPNTGVAWTEAGVNAIQAQYERTT